MSDENDARSNWAEYFDKSRNHYRAARFVGERLESCVFISQNTELLERDWLISLFQRDTLDPGER